MKKDGHNQQLKKVTNRAYEIKTIRCFIGIKQPMPGSSEEYHGNDCYK